MSKLTLIKKTLFRRSKRVGSSSEQLSFYYQGLLEYFTGDLCLNDDDVYIALYMYTVCIYKAIESGDKVVLKELLSRCSEIRSIASKFSHCPQKLRKDKYCMSFSLDVAIAQARFYLRDYNGFIGDVRCAVDKAKFYIESGNSEFCIAYGNIWRFLCWHLLISAAREEFEEVDSTACLIIKVFKGYNQFILEGDINRFDELNFYFNRHLFTVFQFAKKFKSSSNKIDSLKYGLFERLALHTFHGDEVGMQLHHNFDDFLSFVCE